MLYRIGFESFSCARSIMSTDLAFCFFRILPVVAGFLLLTIPFLWGAQFAANVQAKTQDAVDATLLGAQVTRLNKNTKLRHTATSTRDGSHAINHLAPVSCPIAAGADGVAPATVNFIPTKAMFYLQFRRL